MRRIITILIGIALVGVLMPSLQASETVSRGYVGGTASIAGSGAGVIMCREPGDTPAQCQVLEQLGFNSGIGGTRLRAAGLYQNVIINGNDDLYSTDVAMLPCFLNPDGDTVCDSDDWRGSRNCGPQALLGAPFASGFASIFTYSVLVTADLEMCGASTGTMHGTFF